MLAATLTLTATHLGVAQSPAPPDRGAAWREDLDTFAREFAARQLDFATLYPRAAFDAALAGLRRDVPRLSDAEIALALTRLVASARVGHTLVRPPQGNRRYARLPVAFAWYADGLAVSAADAAYREALGLKVLRIGRLTPDDLLRAVAPWVSYELDGWLRLQGAATMTIHPLLQSLGQTEPDGRVRLTLARPDATTLDLLVAPDTAARTTPLINAADALGLPMTLLRKRPAANYWYERLADRRALYIQYNRCQDDAADPFAAFTTRLLADADAHRQEIDRVVIDLRLNAGGDSRVIEPLLTGLRKRRHLGGRGRLFALIGPQTFSSGLLAAVALRQIGATFVGEPAGEAMNSYGQVHTFTLPHSGLVVQYSTKFFQLTKKAREVAAFEPDLTVSRTLADALAGRDPALEAALPPRHP
jgi:hypothetical protein